MSDEKEIEIFDETSEKMKEVEVSKFRHSPLPRPVLLSTMYMLGVMPLMVSADRVRDELGDDEPPRTPQPPVRIVEPPRIAITADSFAGLLPPHRSRPDRSVRQQERRKRNKSAAASRRKNRSK